MPTPSLIVLDHGTTFITEFADSAEKEGFLQMPRFNYFNKVRQRAVEIFNTYLHVTGCRKEWQMDWVKVHACAAVCAAYLDIMSYVTKLDATFDKTRMNIVIKELHRTVSPGLLYCGNSSQSNDSMMQCWSQFMTKLFNDMREISRRYSGLRHAHAARMSMESGLEEGEAVNHYTKFLGFVYAKMRPVLSDYRRTLAQKSDEIIVLLCKHFAYNDEFRVAAQEYAMKYMECFPDVADDTNNEQRNLPLLIASAAMDCCRPHCGDTTDDKEVEAVYMAMCHYTLDEIRVVKENMLKRPVDPAVRALNLIESNFVASIPDVKRRQALRQEAEQQTAPLTVDHYWAQMHATFDSECFGDLLVEE